MNKQTLHTALSLALLMPLFAACLPAVTLSAVPLAEALQKSELEDTKAPGFPDALEPVTALMLNKPADEAEQQAFEARIASLARHRDSRVGRLFFTALAATPDIVDVPADALSAVVTAEWPLALGASLRVRVEYRRQGENWLIATLQVNVDGTAASPVTGMAPYFGQGPDRVDLLNLEVLDYLVGRDPADRVLPELERAAFDYEAALVKLFTAEADVLDATLDHLVKKTDPGELPAARLAALQEHLATEAEVKAMRDANANEETRGVFWQGIQEQLKQARQDPRPASVPKSAGGRASVTVSSSSETGTRKSTVTAIRLRTGKLALRAD